MREIHCGLYLKYYKGNDIRNIVSELKNINNIDGNLKVGEKILIPIFN